jgi:hypothetical protein
LEVQKELEMPLIGNSSLQRKLTFVIVCTSLVGLCLACLSFEFYERTSFRSAMTSELSALADILGANTAASLAFNDRKSAQDMLDALRAERHIVAARLYDSRGMVFAEYRREGIGPEFATSPCAKTEPNSRRTLSLSTEAFPWGARKPATSSSSLISALSKPRSGSTRKSL